MLKKLSTEGIENKSCPRKSRKARKMVHEEMVHERHEKWSTKKLSTKDTKRHEKRSTKRLFTEDFCPRKNTKKDLSWTKRSPESALIFLSCFFVLFVDKDLLWIRSGVFAGPQAPASGGRGCSLGAGARETRMMTRNPAGRGIDKREGKGSRSLGTSGMR